MNAPRTGSVSIAPALIAAAAPAGAAGFDEVEFN